MHVLVCTGSVCVGVLLCTQSCMCRCAHMYWRVQALHVQADLMHVGRGVLLCTGTLCTSVSVQSFMCTGVCARSLCRYICADSVCANAPSRICVHRGVCVCACRLTGTGVHAGSVWVSRSHVSPCAHAGCACSGMWLQIHDSAHPTAVLPGETRSSLCVHVCVRVCTCVCVCACVCAPLLSSAGWSKPRAVCTCRSCGQTKSPGMGWVTVPSRVPNPTVLCQSYGAGGGAAALLLSPSCPPCHHGSSSSPIPPGLLWLEQACGGAGLPARPQGSLTEMVRAQQRGQGRLRPTHHPSGMVLGCGMAHADLGKGTSQCMHALALMPAQTCGCAVTGALAPLRVVAASVLTVSAPGPKDPALIALVPK
ncbi:uncharacterized protein LOC129736941 [Falco cherrug]|uniref:uncharacterized protein LOC129736941 n=1 Tax=Falco cherrug TaxID=345164 RepID=UPI00247A1744|nr:uncharacterized protein LOC129736941 [Falco cherrug]